MPQTGTASNSAGGGDTQGARLRGASQDSAEAASFMRRVKGGSPMLEDTEVPGSPLVLITLYPFLRIKVGRIRHSV